VTPLVVLAIASMLALQNLPGSPGVRLEVAFSRLRPIAQGVTAALALFAITSLGPSGVAPFIYFQF
jgi:hypothetical protein